jgi:hypothetical protein
MIVIWLFNQLCFLDSDFFHIEDFSQMTRVSLVYYLGVDPKIGSSSGQDSAQYQGWHYRWHFDGHEQKKRLDNVDTLFKASNVSRRNRNEI